MSKFPIFVAIAAAVLALGYFAYVSEALTYMGSDPATCNNCHVMDAQYENYYHSRHEAWATCSDCHLPHGNIVSYYLEKGRSGMHDVYIFSTGQTPDVIRATASSKEIIQENCIHCHEGTVDAMLASTQALDRNCWDCHRDVAHGQRGISIAPYQDSSVYTK